MKPELVFPDKIYPVGGNGRDLTFTGKGIAACHLVSRRHLYKEVIN